MFYIPGYEGLYQITPEGEVYSVTRKVNSPISGGERTVPAQFMQTQLVKGYPAFRASRGHKKRTVYVHRVLAQLFVPNPDGKPHVNHKNGDKADYRVENLEWCTHKENMEHAHRTGLAKHPKNGPGEQSPSAKLTNESVRAIRRLLAEGQRKRDICKKFGVSSSTIRFIEKRETWKGVEP